METETYLKDKAWAKTYLGISGASLEKAMRDPIDSLPYLKIGNLVRFDPSQVATWAERRCVQRSSLSTGGGQMTAAVA